MAVSLVYIVEQEPGGPVKIGTSKNLRRRLKTLQGFSPTPITLLCAFPGGRVEEQRLHRRFAHLRLRNEWFRRDYEIRRFIESVQQEQYCWSLLTEPLGALDW